MNEVRKREKKVENDQNKDKKEKKESEELIKYPHLLEHDEIEEGCSRMQFWIIMIIVVIFLSVYFYYGYQLAYKVTIYFLRRNAWEFEFWPLTALHNYHMEHSPQHYQHILHQVPGMQDL